MFVMGTLVLSTVSLSGNVSAAGVAGTWTSRISGEGYTQTYMGPGGGMITDKFDVKLVLSGSDDSITGTVTADGKTYPVEGYFDGTTFHMTAHYGWDGAGYMNPVYTLAVEGDQMYGSGSYLNVGVTITGYFDLEKGGLFFNPSGITPVVSAGAIAISIAAIVIASTTPKVSKSGFTPQAGTVQPYQPSYEPSKQWTTEQPIQPISADGATYLGGAGLQLPTPPPAGRPYPPKEHFGKVSQQPPRCPIHGDVALAPHFSNTDMNDPGSWYCVKCKGYPWGKY
jgi:hypothetical protein